MAAIAVAVIAMAMAVVAMTVIAAMAAMAVLSWLACVENQDVVGSSRWYRRRTCDAQWQLTLDVHADHLQTVRVIAPPVRPPLCAHRCFGLALGAPDGHLVPLLTAATLQQQSVYTHMM